MLGFDRTTRRDLLWIALLSLAFQAFWALRMEHPTYFDAYYYTTNGQNLASGQGFNEVVIWQYLDDPAGLPKPSHTYWMPLPSILAAVGYTIIDSFRGAQLPFWLMAGLLPWLGYAVNWYLTRERGQARLAALFTMAGGYYAAYWVQPSTFVLFAWVGGGCLLALAWASVRGTAVLWLIAGLAAGLGHLTRADGIVLLGVGGLTWLGGVWTWRRKEAADQSWGSWPAGLAAFLGGYLLVMGGWFWRTWQVTGQPLSTVGTQTLFLTEYNDIFSYGRYFDLSGYLAWGWENILLSKLEAFWLGLQTFIGVTGLTVFTFFMVWAWIVLGRRERTKVFLRPFTFYTLLLYLLMTLVFTFPGQRGSLLHSSSAIWPWSMGLVVAGVHLFVDWVALRRPHWRPRQAKRVFSVAFLILVFLISFAVSLGQPLWADEGEAYRQIAALVEPDAVLMSASAPAVHYHTGLWSVAVPSEPPPVVLEAAARYGADYLILDADRPPPLAGVYEGTAPRPEFERMGVFNENYVLYRIILPEASE